MLYAFYFQMLENKLSSSLFRLPFSCTCIFSSLCISVVIDVKLFFNLKLLITISTVATHFPNLNYGSHNIFFTKFSDMVTAYIYAVTLMQACQSLHSKKKITIQIIIFSITILPTKPFSNNQNSGLKNGIEKIYKHKKYPHNYFL